MKLVRWPVDGRFWYIEKQCVVWRSCCWSRNLSQDQIMWSCCRMAWCWCWSVLITQSVMLVLVCCWSSRVSWHNYIVTFVTCWLKDVKIYLLFIYSFQKMQCIIYIVYYSDSRSLSCCWSQTAWSWSWSWSWSWTAWSWLRFWSRDFGLANNCWEGNCMGFHLPVPLFSVSYVSARRSTASDSNYYIVVVVPCYGHWLVN